MTMHHAFVGGLLEHTVSLIGLGRAVVAHYPELDADVLLAGIVLHDIGKIDELSYERRDELHYRGPVARTYHDWEFCSCARRSRPFPVFRAAGDCDRTSDLESSRHLRILALPSLPQTREAVALHFLDDMDSKMAAVRASLEGASGGEEWTERNLGAASSAFGATGQNLDANGAGHPAEAATGNPAAAAG